MTSPTSLADHDKTREGDMDDTDDIDETDDLTLSHLSDKRRPGRERERESDDSILGLAMFRDAVDRLGLPYYAESSKA